MEHITKVIIPIITAKTIEFFNVKGNHTYPIKHANNDIIPLNAYRFILHKLLIISPITSINTSIIVPIYCFAFPIGIYLNFFNFFSV
jgi:hypothetical protein